MRRSRRSSAIISAPVNQLPRGRTVAIAGFVLGWLCYSIASNMLTYLHQHRKNGARAAGSIIDAVARAAQNVFFPKGKDEDKLRHAGRRPQKNEQSECY